MTLPFNVNSEALQELPEALQEPLLRFMSSKKESDLGDLVRAALNDFSDGQLPDDLPEDTNLIQDLGLDSLAIAELVFFFEDVFNLKITNEELAELRTLRELKQFLLRRLIG